MDPVAARPQGDNFNRYAYAFNNPYKFLDPDGRDNVLGVKVRYTDGFERESSPTARDQQALNASQRSVDLTVNAVVASGDSARLADTKGWSVTVNPDLSASDEGLAYTGVSLSGDQRTIVTEYTGDVVGLLSEGGHRFYDGYTASGSDAALLHVGGHELAHGSVENQNLQKSGASDKAIERNAGDQSKQISRHSPDVAESKIRSHR